MCDGRATLSVLDTLVSYAKMDEPIEMLWGADPCVCQKKRYSMKSRSDESIRHREGWQDGDAAVRQNSLTSR